MDSRKVIDLLEILSKISHEACEALQLDSHAASETILGLAHKESFEVACDSEQEAALLGALLDSCPDVDAQPVIDRLSELEDSASWHSISVRKLVAFGGHQIELAQFRRAAGIPVEDDLEDVQEEADTSAMLASSEYSETRIANLVRGLLSCSLALRLAKLRGEIDAVAFLARNEGLLIGQLQNAIEAKARSVKSASRRENALETHRSEILDLFESMRGHPMSDFYKRVEQRTGLKERRVREVLRAAGKIRRRNRK